MAYTATIGMPPARTPTALEQRLAAQAQIPFKYVLLAAVGTAQSASWQPLAVARSSEELQQFLQAWLTVETNQQTFTGQTRIALVPELS